MVCGTRNKRRATNEEISINLVNDVESNEILAIIQFQDHKEVERIKKSTFFLVFRHWFTRSSFFWEHHERDKRIPNPWKKKGHKKLLMQHFRFIGLSKEGMSEKDGNFVEKRRRKLGNNILIWYLKLLYGFLCNNIGFLFLLNITFFIFIFM